MENRNFRGILIVVLSLIILSISIEYIVFAKNIDMNDIQKGSLWSVAITDVELKDKLNATNNRTEFDSFSVSSFDIINEKDGFIDYKVTVKNKGALEAKLDSIITYSEDPNLLIECKGMKQYDILMPNEDLNFDIKITYTKEIETSKIVNFKVLLLFVQNN